MVCLHAKLIAGSDVSDQKMAETFIILTWWSAPMPGLSNPLIEMMGMMRKLKKEMIGNIGYDLCNNISAIGHT